MKILTIITAVFSVLMCFGQEEQNAQMYEKVKKSLVIIRAFEKGRQVSSGTGFFISPNGKILTANHLIENYDSFHVWSAEGRYFAVKKVDSISKKADLVFIEVNTGQKQVSSLSLNQAVFYEGDPAFSITLNDKGEASVSEGYVSVIRIFEGIGPGILTAMHVDETFDGAPLLNMTGEVIGIFSYPLIERFDKFFAVSVKIILENEFYKPINYTEFKITEQKTDEKTSKENLKIIEKEGLNFDSIVAMLPRLKALGDTIKDGWNEYSRMDALTDFIPLFVKALKVRGSYYYNFNDLSFMYKLQSPDNTFRLFNWTLRFDDGTYRYYGAIQFNSLNLRLIPLYDYSHMIPFDEVEDTVLTNESWFGVQYYDMALFRKGKKNYYVLLGWDGNNYISTKKIIDVLTFTEEREARFGAPIFKDTLRVKYRVVLHYNKNAIVALKFIRSKKLIVFDNLVPPIPSDTGKLWTYLPDGSYNYFKFKKGMFIFNEDVFSHEKISQEDLNEPEEISGIPEKRDSKKSGLIKP